MHLNVVGLSHHTAPLDVRDRVALTETRQTQVLTLLKSSDKLLETVVLSTCNRSEVYATTNGPEVDPRPVEAWFHQIHGQSDGTLAQYLYRFTDEAAVRHLFRVVSSLDSMVVGEQQILGQVKDAYLRSLEEQMTGVVLNRLFERALEVGKLVRETTDIGVGAVSVSSVAVELAKKIFQDLGRHTAMLIGAGETGELTAQYLTESGIKTVIVANRTYERAVELAARIHGRAVLFDEVHRWMTEVDIVLSSTGAPHVILHRDEMVQIMHERRNRTIFLIDIAVPRDIDPQVRSVSNVFLYDIDDLQSVVDDNAERRRKEATKAERIVDAEVAKFLGWYRGLAVTPTIAQLRQYADQIRASEVEHALARLKHLPETDQKMIQQMSLAIVNKLLHTPTVRLKAFADPGRELQYLNALRYLFGLDEE